MNAAKLYLNKNSFAAIAAAPIIWPVITPASGEAEMPQTGRFILLP